uniref:Uncharacterized mitochondrial protein AtMg00810-like n=1 Tax=Tanacetum cinerariifolium TaxID=118510 RepID=A0A6L2JWB8_TANCI|nr:uncharacterized mitochondrial protein AtMg00810-like [Tanacetum cinerariifolium]
MESQSETIQTVSALKLLVLKTREYDLWSMRMEQYLTFTDHVLWEAILSGDSVSPIALASAGAEGHIPPKTAKQKLARKNELKTKSTLMLAIPDEHLLKFHASFVSSYNFSSTNETVNTAHSAFAASYKDQASTASYADDVIFFFSNQSNALQLDNKDLEQIDTDDLKEIDLKWTKVECYNCHRRGHFARECKAPRNQENINRDALTRNAPVDTSTTNALVVQDGIGSSSSSSSDSESEVLNNVVDSRESDRNDNQVNDRFKKGTITGPKEIRPVWDNTARVNHKNKVTHPHPKRNFVLAAVLTKSRQVQVNAAKQSSHREAISVSAARHVNTDASRPNATLDESNLWHRRLGHIHFKTMNKLVRGNLARGIENQMDHKVKTIRCDNETKFKNRIMNKFCEMKGKFDGKSDDGFFVGYSINCKAFRVFDTTKIIEENLHINFLESKSNVAETRPNWMFDIDTLTMSMNYQPVFAGNQTNGNAGSKANIDIGQAGKKTVPGPQYDTRIFSGAYDDKVEGAVANFNNLELITVVMQRYNGIFISQDKYVADILKKFDFYSVKTISTLIETNKALLKDEEAKDVDVHLYRLMIGSLMYLTVSRSDIMFVVCAYARFQVTPKVSNLHAVKRIFRYLKGQPKLGLWYPKDSPFDLEAFSDSDYTGASLDRKSTIKGCQFFRKRLISWQCKKQIVVAYSTTKAEYVVAANCYGQKKQKSRRKLRKEIEVPSLSSEIPNEECVPTTSNDPLSSEMFRVNDLDGDEVVLDVLASEKVEQIVKVVENEVSTADLVTTAKIKVAKPNAITTAATTSTASGTRPKAKGIVMQEPIKPERPLKRKDQIMMDEEVAKNLEAQIKAELEKEEGLVRLKEEETNIALVAEWGNTQAMIDADCKLVARLQEEEREELTIKEKSRLFVELMHKRKKHFARLRAKKIISKPPNKAQKRNQMCTYLKNMANYKHNQLKNKSFNEI